MREFVSCYLVLDEYSEGRPNNSYANHSIYLDSEDFCSYWDVVNSNRNRYKLRVRFYDDNQATPVFFEIKRRENDAILKQRAAVRRDAVPILLAGQLPEVSHLFSNVPKHLTALQNFSRIMLDIQATPKVHVAYMREAWVSEADNAVRVTFDRQIRAARHLTDDISTKMESFAAAFEPEVILELKFTGRFPLWFGDLVRVFGVRQCGAAKYADHVAVLGQQNIAPGYSPFAEEDAIERLLRRHAVKLGKALSLPRENSLSTAESPVPSSNPTSSNPPSAVSS